ncbi:MAG: pyruvate synthase [Phycisphaerae bacterium]|nr:pyruvate synthase [Phycisphaerae bacterium]
MTTTSDKIKSQVRWLGNGNEAVAQAVLHCCYDGEGYYPITPSSEVGEEVAKAIAAGKTDMKYVIGTSELAAIGICTGMALAGGRVVDVTSAQGLLLKYEELSTVSGLGLPMVLNLSTREINAPLNIKNGHSDLMTMLGTGWLIFMAPTVQAAYDMNIIALKVAEEVLLPAVVAYDGFHTSHANRRIQVFENTQDVQEFLGEKPIDRILSGKSKQCSVVDTKNPKTMGPYMNDDLMNTKVVMEQKMEHALNVVIPRVLKEFAEISGREYGLVQQYGDKNAATCMVALNTAGEAAKDAVDLLDRKDEKVNLVIPMLLRPWPENQISDAVGAAKKILVAERATQYGANNFMANELGAALQKKGNNAKIIQRTYGMGGLNFRLDDALYLYDLIKKWPNVEDENEKREKWYYGVWAGDPSYNPPVVVEPIKTEDCSINAKLERPNLKELSKMPNRIEKHAACPGCGIFANINLFLRGIDGQVILLFNTGCGMVTATGFPYTSFKVPYAHNLFHNASSTATGIVEMIDKFKKDNKVSDDITVICVSGDGGDDIGMDQVIAAALRNDPFIFMEYDNKGYMNTGAQMCYSGFKGQKNSNAHVGPNQQGKLTHHKDIIEILRGTYAPYLFQAAESQPIDMIRKARRAQQIVREGGFAFGKVFSTCPLNWGLEEARCPQAVAKVVDACLHPLYEIDHGKTTLNYNPEEKGKKIAVTEAFASMGAGFAHLAKPNFATLMEETQKHVDYRWERLKAMSGSTVL